MRIRHPVLALLLLSGAVALGLVLLGRGRTHLPHEVAAPFVGEKVAVVDLVGVITSSGGTDGAAVNARRVVERLEKLTADPAVRAIVLRINSPGGTVVGSQDIHAAVGRTRAAGKPVVASMAEIAASGGYYVSCAADRVVASPGTLTGSIGVIMQFPDLTGLLGKIGVDAATIKSGEFKDIGNSFRTMTERDRKVLQDLVDDVYGQFVDVVAQGRSLPEKRVREIADGRIYSGRQALELGLVDELGDLDAAVAAAAKLAGIAGRPQVERDKLRRSVWELLDGRASALLGALPGTAAGVPGAQPMYLWR